VSTAPDDCHQANIVHDRVVELVDKLALNDSRIRRQEPGGVHRMRVTLRRLRSLLSTFAPLYDEATVTSRREGLKWVAGELGGARDAQVVRLRLRAMATTPEERALADAVDDELSGADTEAVGSPVVVLDTDRHSQILRDLTSFATDPPWSEKTGPEVVLQHRVRKDWKRLRRRARDAADAHGGAEHDAALHEVRKAAKRLRYGVETLVPLYGDEAVRLARRAKRLQTDLGEVQDSAVVQVKMRQFAGLPGRTPREVFLLGGFYSREQAKAARAETSYAESWSKLARKKHRRWLT
jgi:CHAD domain-containing protein